MASNSSSDDVELPIATDDRGDEWPARCAGDRGLCQRLYDRCHHQLYVLMARMVGEQDAADLTQQSFLRAFTKIDQFAGRSTLETWLCRIAINEALQHLRRRRGSRYQPILSEPMSPRGREEDLDERRELLERALSRIDPELRSAFLLREVEGLSYREIAEVIEIPEGTVGSRLNRARRELRVQLVALGWEA